MDKKPNKIIIKYLLIAALLALGVIYFSSITGAAALLWHIAFPAVIGFVLAYIINILEIKFERIYFPKSSKPIIKATRRPVSIALSVLVILAAAVSIGVFVVPRIVQALIDTAQAIPQAVEMLNGFIDQYRDQIPLIAERMGEVNIDWDGISKTISNYAIQGIGGVFDSMFGFASNVVSALYTLFMSLTIAFHLLSGKDRIINQLRSAQGAFMKPSRVITMNHALAVAHESFSSYIFGQCAEVLILSVLCTLGMWIFRFPFATTIGVFVGITALIPMVGAYLGAGVGALLILTVDPLQALFFLIYISVLQQLENNFIYPKVVGKSVGLPSVWVLVSVLICGGLFGVPGMMISVPFTATVYKLLKESVEKKNKGYEA